MSLYLLSVDYVNSYFNYFLIPDVFFKLCFCLS